MFDCAKDEQDTLMILACSGGSNVGRLAGRAAEELTCEGFGRMFSLAGIGAGLEDFIRRAREMPDMVVLDGCPTGCARLVLERAGVPLKSYVVVTDLGIEKHGDLCQPLDPGEVASVKQVAKASVAFFRQTNRGPSTCCTWPGGEV